LPPTGLARPLDNYLRLMKPVHFALLVIAAAIGIQAATDEAHLDTHTVLCAFF
jgi:hypothetical protein